jgi:hypothetical protein
MSRDWTLYSPFPVLEIKFCTYVNVSILSVQVKMVSTAYLSWSRKANVTHIWTYLWGSFFSELAKVGWSALIMEGTILWTESWTGWRRCRKWALALMSLWFLTVDAYWPAFSCLYFWDFCLHGLWTKRKFLFKLHLSLILTYPHIYMYMVYVLMCNTYTHTCIYIRPPYHVFFYSI